MPQPDSGDNCCDCPSRTGPCDDCGGTVACCFNDSTCQNLSHNACIAAGGTPRGTGTTCSDHGGFPCCTTCEPIEFGTPCTDLDGNCWTVQNCDGTCSGQQADCSNNWMYHITWCTAGGEGCGITVNCVSFTNPQTCEITMIGACDGICPPGQGIIDGVSDPFIACP